MNSTHHERRRSDESRRGVLLLVVLSMLTLFLLLGTAYLVVSTRSRETARAYNRLIMQSDSVRIPHAELLDAAFLQVVRGGTAPMVIQPSISSFSFESLLEDKYGRGNTLSGTATSITYQPPLIQATVMVASATSAAFTLQGRVLSFVSDGGDVTTHRILSGTGNPGGPFSLLLDAASSWAAIQAPTAPCRVLINGREFDGQSSDTVSGAVINEAWDGFDHAQNPFLANVKPLTSGNLIASSTVSKPSYLSSSSLLSGTTNGIPDAADNDNDGWNDSLFLKFGFPGFTVGSGTIELAAAVLIMDLDARFNVNAHGSLTRSLYLTNPPHSGWPTSASLAATGTNFTDVPMGSGYGPAEVNADALFPQTGNGSYATQRLQPGETPTIWLMTGVTGTSLIGRRPAGSRFSESVISPRLQSLQGRYGERVGWPTLASGTSTLPTTTPVAPGPSLPGQAGLDDLVSRINDMRAPPANSGPGGQVNEADGMGIPSLWWTGAANFNWAATGSGGGLPRAVYNSPPDLHGRMKTTMVGPTGQGVAPQLIFAKPEWGAGETTDDPYELRLDSHAARNGWMGDPNTSGFMPVYDNVFMVSELEAVLRPYDIDSTKLPLRLAAVLGSVAEEARLRITTDSWDTTMITGTAAKNLSEWLQKVSGTTARVSGTSAVTGAIGGEVARGERFDLNRPVTSAKPADYDPTHPYYVQRQAYFKDLYTLVCALLHPSSAPSSTQAATYAQWAANVVEFRDADSTMTPFEYDENPFDGWQVDNNARTDGEQDRKLLWGAERPELLIAATSAWEDNAKGELFIMLHRPWNARAFSSGTSTPAEPIDPALDESTTNPTNLLDLGKKSGPGTATSTYPVWRLRITGSNGASSIVRLDVTSGTTGELSSSAVTNAAATPKLAVDSWLCIQGSNSINAVITASGSVTIDQGGTFRTPGPLPIASGTQPRLATVYLERLTDPAIEVSPSKNQSAWTTGTSAAATSGTATTGTTVPIYRVVDQAPIEVVNRMKDPVTGKVPVSGIATTLSRNAGGTMWKALTSATSAVVTTAETVNGLKDGPRLEGLKASAQPNNAVWYTWPNRPFVSAAELLFVPSDDSLAMLTQYVKPSIATTKLPSPFLFDAVHVPTRFAGIHETVTAGAGLTRLETAGIFRETTKVNQLSSFREPGRVNLNTVTADDVWNAVVAGPLVQPSSTTPDPIRSRAAANFETAPATTTAALLALSGTSTTVASDANAALSSGTAFNPAQSIYTATRLANTTTIRSNVFAVWITLRESVAGDPDTVKYHRGFYIIDRSIPVAHEAGKDHNVWDAVLLRRIIE
ncbi:MAG: hypothetical protein K8S94_01345 [Planctomycetia bacterium]|nr:hypothetical protein [Planctomycetia bacterium]